MEKAFIALLIIAAGIVVFVIGRKSNNRQAFLGGAVALVVGVLMFLSILLFQVDEGEAIVLTQFGKVYDSITTPGLNFKRPWANTYSYPKRLRENTMSLTIRSKDGMAVRIDLTTWYRVDVEHVEDIYKLIAKDLSSLERNIILPSIRTTIRDSLSTLNSREIYKKRATISDQILKDANAMLSQKYTIVDKILLREIRLPKTVEDAIEMKIKAQQEAEAAEYQKEKAKKEAEIKEVEAKGIAKAQSIINKTLTPYYLQHEAIQSYEKLAQSPNTTFIILPTSPKATGMPIILNAPGNK